MERARMSTSDIPGAGAGGAPLLVRSYSAGSSGGGAGGVNSRREQSDERRPAEGWEQRVERLKKKAGEKRARFYIVRRCLHMLICWRDDTKL